MPQGGIDKHAIAKMMKDIQREFNKHPIRVPLQTQGPTLAQCLGSYAQGQTPTDR